MKKLIHIQPFPINAESDGFIAALASAVMPCLGIHEETPYWCAPKGHYCVNCGGCGEETNVAKHQVMLYHTLLTASGLAFTFDYPEDDQVGFHTMPNTPVGWRWEEPFVMDIMDFVGLSYKRYSGKSIVEMHKTIKNAVDSGCTALVSNHGTWSNDSEWSQCWRVVCGYTDDSICVMRHGGEIVSETETTYQDWIVITGKVERKQIYRDVLERIYRVLSDPSHKKLERLIYDLLSSVTPDNAIKLSKMMIGINGVLIESRWHSAEAFSSCDTLLSSLTDNDAVKRRLSDLFFTRYIADNQNETHGIGWKIWDALKVGPKTEYMSTDESFALIRKPEVQAELTRLFGIVFDNDRAVAAGIMREIVEIRKG